MALNSSEVQPSFTCFCRCRASLFLRAACSSARPSPFVNEAAAVTAVWVSGQEGSVMVPRSSKAPGAVEEAEPPAIRFRNDRPRPPIRHSNSGSR